MLFTIAATIVVLGVLIFIHELGHFLAAKSVDIEVSRFSIGFGPKIVGFTRGETEYVISALPLGGYVKMEGMAGDEVVEPLEGKTEPAREPSPRDFDQKPLLVRFYVIMAGVVMNALFAVVAFAVIASQVGYLIPLITSVVPDSPAERAGIRPGDLIVAIDGRKTVSFDDVYQDIGTRPNETMILSIGRDDQVLNVRLTTAALRNYDELARDTIEIGHIGVGVENTDATYHTMGPVEAVGEGFRQTGRWIGNIGGFLGRIFSGKDSASQLGGPIAIGQMSGQFARAGFLPFLRFMAIISVNLAVLNLLPIPVLDGGHLLFLGVEAVRGREISLEQRMRLTQVGMLFVLGLMVVAIANDILRLVN